MCNIEEKAGKIYRTGQDNQQAKFLLGPLFCHGGPTPTREVASCLDIWRAGDVVPGYHIIKGSEDYLKYLFIIILHHTITLERSDK